MDADISAGIEVRLTTDDDLPDIARLERLAFSDPWSRQAFRAALAEPATFMASACSPAGVLAGYVVAWFAGGEGEIANLAVAPEARGRGVGGRLLDAALQAAAERQAQSVFLEVRQSNVPALKLYASRGFVAVGRRRNYYNKPPEDAILLRLDIGAAS